MTFSKEDLIPLKIAYEKAVENELETFQYHEEEVLTQYAKYCIEYLEGSKNEVIDEEVQTAARISEAVQFVQGASNEELVIVNIPIDGITSPVLCIKRGNKIEPLFIGITKSSIEQILNYKLPT